MEESVYIHQTLPGRNPRGRSSCNVPETGSLTELIRHVLLKRGEKLWLGDFSSGVPTTCLSDCFATSMFGLVSAWVVSLGFGLCLSSLFNSDYTKTFNLALTVEQQ